MGFRVPAPDGAKAADGLPVLVLPGGTELLAGYRLHYLAVGGMSVVYRAEGIKAGKPPVLFAKEVPSTDSRAVVALVQEKSLLERLRHPGIVAVHELFEEDGFYYLLLDFIDGESLDRLISPFPGVFLQERVVLGWGSELADIFAYLHRQEPPIIYRDLKPRNVMKDRAGRLRLVDFGIARYHKEGKSRDTESLGTAATASPEHYTGQTDQRSDIFTLGATLHFLLSNGSAKRRAPFEFPPIRSLNPQVSPQVEEVLMKCLQLDPQQRYASMEDLRGALDRCLGKPQPVSCVRSGELGPSAVRSGEPLPVAPEVAQVTAALPSGPAPQGARSVPWAALALGFGLVLAGMAGGVWLSRERAPQPGPGVVASRPPEPEPSILTPPPNTELPITPSTPSPQPVPSPSSPAPSRPVPTPRPVSSRPLPRPEPERTVALLPDTPAYPVHRPGPTREPAGPGPESLPGDSGDLPFFEAPWLFNYRAPRQPVEGQSGPGGTVIQARGLRMLVPSGYQQLRRGLDNVFVAGERRDLRVLRLRGTERTLLGPEELVRHYATQNPTVEGGQLTHLTVMGAPAAAWDGVTPLGGERLPVKIRTRAVFWRDGSRAYMLALSALPRAFPSEELEAVLASLARE